MNNFDVNRAVGQALGTYTGKELWVYIPQNEFIALSVLYPGLYAHAGQVCLDACYLLAQHYNVKVLTRKKLIMPKPWVQITWTPDRATKMIGREIELGGEEIINSKPMDQITNFLWSYLQ